MQHFTALNKVCSNNDAGESFDAQQIAVCTTALQTASWQTLCGRAQRWVNGAAEDIAGMVAFLASAQGQYITGTAITIDGGFNA